MVEKYLYQNYLVMILCSYGSNKPNAIVKITGRPGEKIHESMFSIHDSIIEKENYFVLVSDINLGKDYTNYYGEKNTNKYDYNSGENEKISNSELKKLVLLNEV